jgi:hypothetical protein
MKLKIRDEFEKFLSDNEKGEVNHGDKLIAALEEARQSWQRNRDQANSAKWRNNIAFYAGNHSVRLRNDPSRYRVDVRENHTNNTIQRIASIVVQNMPISRVFPATDSYQDVQDGETCEDYVKYFYRTKALEIKLAKAVKYTLITGNSFLFRAWDPYACGSMYLSEEEAGGAAGVHRWTGDIRVDVDDPMRINVRPGIEELCDMFDFFRSLPSNKADLEAIHGSIESDPVRAMNAYSNQVRSDDDLVMVHHYYHKPTHWCEKGMYISYAGKKILKATIYNPKSGKLPIEHLPFDTPPMSFWALSSMDQIMDLQEQLDRAASMIIEARNLMARPRVLASEEAKVPGQQFTDRPGDILRYKLAGGKPEFYVPNFNFAELANHKSDLRGALQAVSGMTGASRGEIPAATKTALALQLVLEQDRSQWAPFIKMFYQMIKETNLGILELAAENISEEDPRVIKIEQNNIVGTKTFHGGLVPSPLDIDLQDTNPLGWTAGAKIENVQTLAQIGVLKDPNQILEMLKLNSPDPAYQYQHINRQTARKENELLNKGEDVKVESEDLDPVHLEEHVKEMCAFNYKLKPKAVKAAFEKHVAAHKQRLAGVAPQGGAPANPSQAGLESLDNLAKQNAPLQQGSGIMDQLLTSARSG